MPPAARIGDMHVCPMVTGVVPHVGGPILLGLPSVLVGGMPQARQTDLATCVGPPDAIAMGSTGVLVGGLPAARMLDPTMHGGTIIIGLPTVIIGEQGNGGGGGGGAPGVPRPPLEGGAGNLAAMLEALLEAAKAGVPFAQQCMKLP